MIINTKQQADTLISKLKDVELIAIDTETVSIEDKTLIAFSISYDNKRYVIPVAMKYVQNLDKSLWHEILKKACYRNGTIYHNYSFDGQVLFPYLPEINEYRPHDTMIISHLLNEHGSHGLKQLAQKHLNYEMLTYKEVCGTGKKQISFAELQDKEIINKYAGDDALMTKKLYQRLHDKLKDIDSLHSCYEEIERPLLNVILDMHLQGVPVDKNHVKQVANFCQEQCDKFSRLITNKMKDVNINSPKQLREWFIQKKRMPVHKRSFKTNNPSVDSEVLKQYAKQLEEAQWILDYRKYSKILNTFIPALTPSHGNRIYPSFRQIGTTSGRFSSASPNFQNIPKNKEDEIELRRCIKANEDKLLVGADYSQMELRLAAHYSQDKSAIQAYRDGIDMHKITAQATGLERRKAKIVNFGVLYAMSSKTLAKTIDKTRKEAAWFIHEFFNTYPGFLRMRHQTRQELFDKGYIELYGGRRRRLSEEFSDKEEWKQRSEIRSIINALIQGSGAMIIKKAMILMFDKLKQYNAHIIAQVHDELIVECPKEHAELVKNIVEDCMIEPTKHMKIPFALDIAIGKSWKDIK